MCRCCSIPNPKRAAIIGLGSGVTLGSALTPSDHRGDGARDFARGRRRRRASSRTENHRALGDPRTRLIVGDGRTHLMLGTPDLRRDRLRAVESVDGGHRVALHARVLRRRARPAGAGRRAVPVGAHLRHQQRRSAIDRRDVPVGVPGRHACGWSAMPTCCWSDRPSRSTPASPASRPRCSGPAWPRDLASVGVNGPVLGHLAVRRAGRCAEGLGRRRAAADRRPLGARVLGTAQHFRQRRATTTRRRCASWPPRVRSLPAVARALASATAEDWRDRGLMLLKADAHPAGLRRPRPRARIEPERHGGARRPAAGGRVAQQDLSTSRRCLTKLAADPSHKAAPSSRCRACSRRKGTSRRPSGFPWTMLQANPADVAALEQLASILSDVGDAGRLEPVVQRLVKEAPKNTWAHYYAASLFFIQGRLDMALQAARNAVAIDPSNAKAHNLIGACLASMGQTDAARTAFETSIKADPREPGTYANLATLELQSGKSRSRARGTSPKRSRSIRTTRPRATDSRRSLEFNSLKYRSNFVDCVARECGRATASSVCKKCHVQRAQLDREALVSPAAMTSSRLSGMRLAKFRQSKGNRFDERRSHSGVLDAVVRMCRRSVPRHCQHARGHLRGRKRRRLRKPRASPQPHGVGRA